jgi:3-dehydroquinate synthase
VKEDAGGRGGDLLIVTDRNVARRYLEPVSSSLRAAGLRVPSAVLPAGEKTKSGRYLFALLSRMVREGLTRESVVVALGGGVIGDLAGFAASVYMRGCGLVQVPTTLLAQIDSSVGGKTGIDLREGKNLVGTFHNPRLVVIDPTVLETLPARELLAGFAELLKHGLIFDEELFGDIESSFRRRFGPDAAPTAGKAGKWILADLSRLSDLIVRSVRIKAEIVTADERERGLRMILNFGHTFGHALEQLTRYRRFLHGEAVYLGMDMATRLSARLGMLAGDEAARVTALLGTLPLPGLRGIRPRELLRQMARDKKVRGGRLHLVVLEGIGKALTREDVGEDAILQSIREALAGRA